MAQALKNDPKMVILAAAQAQKAAAYVLLGTGVDHAAEPIALDIAA
jgi:hypothetical protein